MNISSSLASFEFADDSIVCGNCGKPAIQNLRARTILKCPACGVFSTSPEQAQCLFVARGLEEAATT